MFLRRLKKVTGLWERRDKSVRQVFSDFNRTLLLMVEPGGLQASIAARMREIYQADQLLIFQREPAEGLFVPTYWTGIELTSEARAGVRAQGRLVRWLKANETSLVVRQSPDVVEYLSEDEQELIRSLNIQICIPLLSLNRVTGFVLMGSSRLRQGVPHEQLELLQLLAGQAALALENAALYAEQRDRLRRLHRIERLAAVGQLAAGVAHEIRNPLTAIRSTIQFLQQRANGDDPKSELIGDVLDEIDRIDRTVNGLLTLSRPESFEPQPINLAEVVQQVIVLVTQQAKKAKVGIEQRLEESELIVSADRNQLVKVFFNLVTNALESMPDGGQLRVAAQRVAPEHWHESERGFAEVRIVDSGSGIEAEHLSRIFDPFFTTKRSGTGLGLAICHGIVQRHDGEIELRNVSPHGVAAIVRLPLGDGQDSPRSHKKTAEA